MISVKKQGPYEVFSRGVEEPWLIWRDGKLYRQVWTWEEVEKVLRDEAPKAVRKSKAQRARELERDVLRRLAEEREKRQRWLVTFQLPGSPWVYVTRSGSGTLNPDDAFDFGSRDAAESRAAAMQGPRSSLRAKVTSRPKA